MLFAPLPESIGKAFEVLFPDGIKNFPHRVLNDFILQRRDPQWPLPAIGFRDIDPSRWLRPIGSTMNPAVKVLQSLLQALSIFFPRHSVHPGRSLLLESKIA